MGTRVGCRYEEVATVIRKDGSSFGCSALLSEDVGDVMSSPGDSAGLPGGSEAWSESPMPVEEITRPPTPEDERQLLVRKRRKWGLLALAAWTLAAGGAGLVGGWSLGHNSSLSSPPPDKHIIEVPAVEQQSDLVIPDVRGLTSTDAKQALVDAGFDAAVIKAEELQWGGESDIVIVQSPVVGEIVKDSIILEISAATQMPDVVGNGQTEAIAALGAVGVDPEVVEEFDLATRTGTVLKSSPEAGQPLTDAVQLTVARAGASLFLSTLEQVERSCSTVEARINGKAHPNSLECQGGQEEPTVGFWLLDRHAMLITGTIGVDDRGESAAAGTVTFVGDGAELGSYVVSYAKPQEVSLNVEGVLRLEILVSAPEGGEVVLSDLLVKGTSSGIADLGVQ